uniref:Uncharacterized protein n=1 Tax=Helianthus annuus TaxID=4232 RepID=A0A251VH88_HELAN
MDSPRDLLKFWIWSLTFQKHTNGARGLHFVTHLVPIFSRSIWMVPVVCIL